MNNPFALTEEPAADQDTLQALRAKAQELHRVDRQIEALEAQLKDLKEQKRVIEEHDLTTLMDSIGMTTFELSDGWSTKTTDKLYMQSGGADKYRGPRAKFVTETGNGSLIKSEVVATLSKGEAAAAEQLMGYLQEHGISAKRADNVNPASLKSLVKELLEQGKNVPLKELGIYQQRKVEIVNNG